MDGSVVFGITFWVIIIFLTINKLIKNYYEKQYQKDYERRIKSNPIPPKEIQEKKPIPVVKESKEEKIIVDHFRWKNSICEQFDNSHGIVKLLKNENVDNITYGMLLNCFEWKYKRFKILMRDKYMCQICGLKSLSNHVHHKYYVKKQLPWTIDNKGLVTLCNMCHVETHKKNKIPIYEINNNQFIEINKTNHHCYRCGGIGYLPQFNHVENGICFKCHGDSLDKSVFKPILNQIRTKYLPYSEENERNKYRSHIKALTFEEIVENYPFLEPFIIKTTKSSNDIDNLDDINLLPF
jgi:hypothetical protein